MAYWDKNTSSSPSYDNYYSILGSVNRKPSGQQEAFYELEPAIVLDIILDKNHAYFQSSKFKLQADQWPQSVEKKAADKADLDYTWMGRALVRLLYSNRNIEKEECVWALPLEANISEYPVLNETVSVIYYLGQYYYTRKINCFNTPNANVDFNLELINGGFRQNDVNAPIQGNRELLIDPNDKRKSYVGPTSNTSPQRTYGYNGALGRYFLYNSRVRALKRREGDLIIESRFGQSIRFGSYDDNRVNDKGYNSNFSGYEDYKGQKVINPFSGQETGGGNPMILIRNRQRPITKEGQEIRCYEKLPVVRGTVEEKNVGGYIMEDINNDGTSIHITSGVTISGFQTNCYKKLWGAGEEQSGFNGTTAFTYPILMGDQIVINSDRVVISAKKNEMFQFSKKRMSFVTDDEFTIDAHNQIVINTNTKTVINSPAIYLGEYDQTGEPVLLGQTTVNWLYDLCNWLYDHTHWFTHVHPDAQGGQTGDAIAKKTQWSVQRESLKALRDTLNTLLSRRVFVVGGGFAPGKDGGSIANGAVPISITIPAGGGVPGGFNGANHR